MKWFKHASNANMDAKLQRVLLDYGLEGYGLYWYCLELISSGQVEPDDVAAQFTIIESNTSVSHKKLKTILQLFFELKLFVKCPGVRL